MDSLGNSLERSTLMEKGNESMERSAQTETPASLSVVSVLWFQSMIRAWGFI